MPVLAKARPHAAPSRQLTPCHPALRKACAGRTISPEGETGGVSEGEDGHEGANATRERVAAILERLRRELIHDFGYDYSDNHQWGAQYE